MFKWLQKSVLLSYVFVSSVLLVNVATVAGAQNFARGYSTSDSGLQPGMAVQLSVTSSSEKPEVERADINNANKTIGVATSPSENFALIASGEQTVYVQNNGEANVFVSDVNGDVKQGDKLTISPLRGILMVAKNPSEPVFAVALEDFSQQNSQVYSIDGGVTGVSSSRVSKIRASLDTRSFATGQAVSESALSKIGRSILGRDVGEIRMLIALIIFFIVLVAEGGIIYGAVSSAITALGRNPLASKFIRRELIRVFFIAVFVLCMGLGTIYGILLY